MMKEIKKILRELHDIAMSESHHYKKWHSHPDHSFIHYVLLATIMMGGVGSTALPFVISSPMPNCRIQIRAALAPKDDSSSLFEALDIAHKQGEPDGDNDNPAAEAISRLVSLVDSNCSIPAGAVAAAAKQRNRVLHAGVMKKGKLFSPSSFQATYGVNDTGSSVVMTSSFVDAAGLTWNQPLGPTNVGGRVRAISPNPATPGEILLGSVSGGMWRSSNYGASWSVVGDNTLPNLPITCLTRDPSNSNIVYACTGEGTFNADAMRGNGIYKSTDGGNTWDQIAATSPGTATQITNADWFYVNRIAVSPTNSQVILAATNNGLYRTADGGLTWTKVYQAVGTSSGVQKFRRVMDVDFHPTDGTKVILGEGKHTNCLSTCVADGSAVAYSSDGGITWTRTKLNTSAISNQVGRVEVAWSQSNPQVVYAVVDQAQGQLYKSTDGGVTWTPNAPISTPAHLSTQGWYNSALWVAPNDADRVIVAGYSMKMSTDGGTTWASIGSGVHVDHHTVVSDPSYNTNFTIYVGNDGGIYKGTNVNTGTPSSSSPSFSNINNTLNITQFYSGAGKARGRLVGGTQDNGSLLWSGTSNWTRIWGSDGGDSAADQADGNYVYSETQFGGIVRYTQALSTTPPANASQYICTGITDASCNFNNTNPTILFIPPLALDTNTNTTLYLGAKNLWRSTNIKDPTNTNVSWSIVKSPLPINAYGLVPYISAVSVSPGNSDTVWVGYDDGQVACSTNATTATPTWTKVTMPSGAGYRYTTHIAYDPSNTNRVFISFGGYLAAPPGVNLWVTTNGCTAVPVWTNIHNDLPLAPVRDIAVNPSDPSILYAGTEVGVFTSFDAGQHWITTNTGPGNVPVDRLFWIDNTTLGAATHGRGMFIATVTSSSSTTTPTSTSTPVVVDSTPPTVSISAPTPGSTYSGTVSFAVSASDASGIKAVELYRGSQLIDTTNVSVNNTYNFAWDSTQVADGSQTFTAKAYDNATTSNSSTASVTINTRNSIDNIAPSVNIISPTPGPISTRTKNLKISVSATDDVGISLIQIFLDTNTSPLVSCSSVTTCTANIAVRGLTPGDHIIKAIAYDLSNNSAVTTVTVTK